MRKYLLLALFFWLIPFGSLMAAENMTISLDVEKGKVDLGDSFQIVVVIKNASTQGANLDGIEIPGLSSFLVLGSSDSTQIQIANGASLMVSENRRTVKALKTGDFQLGPIVMRTTDAQGKVVVVKSDVQTVKVVPADVKPLYSAPVEDTVFGNKDETANTKGFDFWNLARNLFMFGLLVLFIYLFRRHQKSVVLDDNPEPVRHRVAVELPDRNRADFWPMLKGNILEFIKKKYQIDTDALTSSEILALLKNKEPRASLVVEMALKICDQGRFSKSMAKQEDVKLWVDKLNGL